MTFRTLALFTAAALAISTPAQAAQYQTATCRIYAEEAAKTIRADDRIVGNLETKTAGGLDAYAAVMDALTDMEQIYREYAAWGYDKVKVDATMAASETAVRAGFVSSTMEPDRLYANHLMSLSSCAEKSARAGHIGQADLAALDAQFEAVYRVLLK